MLSSEADAEAGPETDPGSDAETAPVDAVPPRRSPRVGAVVGLAVGGAVALLVLAALTTAGAFGLARAVAPASAANEYVVDGVRIQYQEESWDFVLTSPRSCPSAEVTVGFSSSLSGRNTESVTDTVPLQAHTPHVYSVPDSASALQYATIESVRCAG